MRIEIIAIGDELLSGITVNTNAAFIGKELAVLGHEIVRHTVLPDEPEKLKAGLQEALNRSELVIVTGGLGPTCDDLTRNVVADIFSSDFRFDEAIAEDLRKRYGDKIISLVDQATVPTKATLLPNRVGTAPGLNFENKIILMPGVPSEMRAMLTNEVIPFLKKQFPVSSTQIEKFLHFCILPESVIDVELRKLQEAYPYVKIGIYPSYGMVSVKLSAEKENQIVPCIEVLTKEFGTYLAPYSKIEEAIHELFITEKKTLALAESCTGGLIAHKITSLAGASEYFLGSLVVYSNSLKQSLLGVTESVLKEKGAVSEEVVRQMWEGVLKATKADYAIAVTGISGPSGGTKEKPVGTIWAAVGKRGETPHVWTFHAKGNRETINASTANRVLGALWRKMKYNIAGGT